MATALTVALMVLTSCASSEGNSASETTVTTAATTTTEAEPPSLESVRQEWDETVLPGLHLVVYSPVIEVEEGVFEVVTISDTTVEIWNHDDKGWGRSGDSFELEFSATMDFSAPFIEEPTLMPVADLDEDGVSEIVPKLISKDWRGTVLMRIDEQWQVAPFDFYTDYPTNLALQGRDLTSFENDCHPSCAEGTTEQLEWKWNGSTFTSRVLTPATTTTTTTTPPPPTAADTGFPTTESEAARYLADELGIAPSEIAGCGSLEPHASGWSCALLDGYMFYVYSDGTFKDVGYIPDDYPGD